MAGVLFTKQKALEKIRAASSKSKEQIIIANGHIIINECILCGAKNMDEPCPIRVTQEEFDSLLLNRTGLVLELPFYENEYEVHTHPGLVSRLDWNDWGDTPDTVGRI